MSSSDAPEPGAGPEDASGPGRSVQSTDVTGAVNKLTNIGHIAGNVFIGTSPAESARPAGRVRWPWIILLAAVVLGVATAVFWKMRADAGRVIEGEASPWVPPDPHNVHRDSAALTDILICQSGAQADTLATQRERFGPDHDGKIPGDFFIGNGRLPQGSAPGERIPDGEIVMGEQWTGGRNVKIAALADIDRYTAHPPATADLNDLQEHGIEIVLVGDLRSDGAPPTPAQTRALRALVRHLQTRCGIRSNHVWAVGQKMPGHPPDGFAGYFSIAAFREELSKP